MGRVNTEKELLIFGALLHDVGKVVYRGISEQGTHSKLGVDFIRETLDADDAASKKIIEQIRYHHASELASARIAENSLAYITYFADNISAGMDRKEEGEDTGFDRSVKLRKIFNILNGHHDDNTLEHEDYNVIRERIKKALSGIPINVQGVGSVLNLLEATCDCIPSSTDKAQLVDVSLFDHAKTTAAIATCIYDYLAAESISDYQAALFDKHASAAYYAKPMFLLWSCDLSGIQNFIYQISGTGALKQLRSRSFYLEMLLEHLMDEMLERLELTRCNLLYTGGGHAYTLLPNTVEVREALSAFCLELKVWLMAHFRTDLYCASAFVVCSADDLMNKAGTKEGSQRYRALYRKLAEEISAVKANRYTAAEISTLNFSPQPALDHTRECSECHRSDLEVSERTGEGAGICPLCSSFASISRDLVNKDVFVVGDAGVLELPFGRFLTAYTQSEYLKKKPNAVRLYTKNDWHTGLGLATHIWMGDYTADTHYKGISDYAAWGATLVDNTEAADDTAEVRGDRSDGVGIERLGVLRADVDNLGAIFSSGLPDDKISISRTATLSRALSDFFKRQVNEILKQGGYRAQIIYSGGDDLFLIGNWSDVIGAARDIRVSLDKYTGNGVLTISAGLGMYEPTYPIARMAAEVGALEEAAKAHPGKNAVALWTDEYVFSWDEFERGVCAKLPKIQQVFNGNDKGKAFIYRLISLLRTVDDAISIPRLAYVLARSFEDDKERGAQTSKMFFDWATDEKERIYLTAALEWYVYSIREKG